ncbi:hypothetical protein DNTS_006397 [Danionella cerebrum]|uniref:Kinesin-like protein KIFC3 n=1 Tax=Danionella cerebrum TaxID=2873325 RepID=A0A553NGY2_9TELE|nr:hypothetical protein DNTS_006397 [Danionella translucida]
MIGWMGSLINKSWLEQERPLRPLDRRKSRLMPVQQCSLLGPAVMYGTRKTWDVEHTSCLQELWNKDLSFDGECSHMTGFQNRSGHIFLKDRWDEWRGKESSVLQRHCLTSDPLETSSSEQQQLLIQTLQERVCEFQARLRSEDAAKRLLIESLHSHDQQLQQKHELPTPQAVDRPLDDRLREPEFPTGARASSFLSQRSVDSPRAAPVSRVHSQEQQREEGGHLALITGLRTQVKELEEKLVDQTQEVERLRSELGATDLEKQLEVLESENQRLKQELSTIQTQTSCSAVSCPHAQDVETLRRELCVRDETFHERERRLAEVEQEMQERTTLLGHLQQQLEETSRHRSQIEQMSESGAADLSQSKTALLEAQARNQALQEQLSLQRELLRELEQQLLDSQRTSSQLRQQLRTDRGRLYALLSKAVGGGNTEGTCRLSKILMYEGEMERAQGHLEAEMQSLEEEKNRVIEEAFIRAESEMKAVHENLAGVRLNLLTLQPALRTLTCDYNCLKRQICQVIGEVSSTNQELLRKYKREMNLRKKCHNELVRLKGNIRVLCRVRPVCAGETDAADTKNLVTFDPDDDAVLYLSNKGKVMTFELDKVFTTQATQEEVFQEVQSLVTSCIDGFNVCIFAYGQTGSGKTYTMEGVPENPGINQRALHLLFHEVSEKPDWDYKITVSMVEIYNETLRNLLGDNPNEKLDIKMCPDGSGQLYVPGLTEFTVQSVEDINKVFDLGHMNRATACTNLNEHSSRSHALLIITVAGFNSSTGHRTSGKLNLVDLAGSERIAKSGAEGSRLREAQCINKSLSALGDVINALRSKHSHVPFRNSRLTYLLQDSLSGDSKTLMMVQFAQRVRTVEIGFSTSSRRQPENSSTSSSPTHDSVECIKQFLCNTSALTYTVLTFPTLLQLDSPPVTPVPLPISRASSAGSTLSSSSKTSTRRRSHSQLSTDRQVDRSSPLVGDGGQVAPLTPGSFVCPHVYACFGVYVSETNEANSMKITVNPPLILRPTAPIWRQTGESGMTLGTQDRGDVALRYVTEQRSLTTAAASGREEARVFPCNKAL